jgi:hypothetical protein
VSLWDNTNALQKAVNSTQRHSEVIQHSLHCIDPHRDAMCWQWGRLREQGKTTKFFFRISENVSIIFSENQTSWESPLSLLSTPSTSNTNIESFEFVEEVASQIPWVVWDLPYIGVLIFYNKGSRYLWSI